MTFLIEVINAAKALTNKDLTNQDLDIEMGDDDENIMEGIEQTTKSVAEFLQDIYSQAFVHLKKLSENHNDQEALKQLDALNVLIEDRVVEDEIGEEEGQLMPLDYDTILEYFKAAVPEVKKLESNPHDLTAKQALEGYNIQMIAFLKWHGYPETWIIPPPDPSRGADDSSPATTSETVVPSIENEDLPDLEPIEVEVEDMSDGRTPFGQVIAIQPIGEKGARVFVNRGTDKYPIHETYPGSKFGRGVAKAWLEEEAFPKATDDKKNKVIRTAKDIKAIKDVVQVARPEGKTSKIEQIRYHLIVARKIDEETGKEKELWISSSELINHNGGKWVSEKGSKIRLQRSKLDRSLQAYISKGINPDTKKQLTDKDKVDMPWLVASKEEEPSPSSRSSSASSDSESTTA